MRLLEALIRSLIGEIIRLMLGIYFRRIELFRAERVPAEGPVLFVSNHPGSITDAFIIATRVPRRVGFIGTVRLFRHRVIGWVLRCCGIVPVNRMQDDARNMRSVMATFEACYRVLEQGEAIGIFPEGITYEDGQLKEVKSGAARMALELEKRHQGKLGLKIAPVGLTYSQKGHYRSEVLVHLGEPIPVAGFLDVYENNKKQGIRALTEHIAEQMRALILDLPDLEQARVVEAVRILYQAQLAELVSPEGLQGQSGGSHELVVGQAVAKAVRYCWDTQPEEVRLFVSRLDVYERWLRKLGLPDAALGRRHGEGRLALSTVLLSLLALLGLPIAIYGGLHRFLPALFIEWAIRRFTHQGVRRAQTPHAAMIAGLLGFGVSYVVYVTLFQTFIGWPYTLYYALSLPPAGLVAFYYASEFQRLPRSVRTLMIRFSRPFLWGRLRVRRKQLVAAIERMRAVYQESNASEIDR